MNKHFNKTSRCATLDPLELVIHVRNAVTIIVKVFVVLNAVAIIVLVSVEDAVTVVVIILCFLGVIIEMSVARYVTYRHL